MAAGDIASITARVERAHALARENHYVRAAGVLHDILTDTNADVRITLAEGIGRQGAPVRMELASLRLWWLREGRQHSSPEFAAECRAVLAEFAAAARGRNWDDYKWLYQRLAEHYQAAGNVAGVTTALYEMFAYEPLDRHSLIKLLEHLHGTVRETNNLAAIIARYYAAGGAPYPALALFIARHMSHEKGGAFAAALRVLLDQPGMSLDELLGTLEIIRAQLDPRQLRQIGEFHTALRYCAAKQAATEERLPVIAALMAEIKKLEAIFPELTAGTNAVCRAHAHAPPEEALHDVAE